MIKWVVEKIKRLANKNYIKITDVLTEGKKLIIKYDVNGDVCQFFEKDKSMEIEYDFKLDKISKSILVIPFLSLFLPVAWITKSNIILDEIDESFLNNIDKIRNAFNNMYEENLFKKIKIKSKKIVKNEIKPIRSSMFFSGGVDSLDTLCTNFDKNPLLIMIWGSDIWLEDIKGWNTAKQNMDKISKKLKKNKTYIKSNFRKTINELKLNEVYEEQLGDNWWHGVEHGMALLGHIAPLVIKYKIAVHYIPGTFSNNDKDVKCASYPTIDENFKVANCSVIHDGFNYTRLDKVKNIVSFSKDNKTGIKFRTCYKERDDKMNCCDCEKCFRTIMELVSIGENPEKYGYEYNKEVINKIKSHLKNNKFEHEILSNMWFDIQQEINKNKYFKVYDLSWINDFDFKSKNSKE